MTSMDFLLWTKGPAFSIALAIFAFGVIIRLAEIFMLGRKPDLSEPRGSAFVAGIKTIFTRTITDSGTFKRAPFPVIVGNIWHIGLFLIILFFIPHIELINAVSGFKWPGLPNPVIDAITVITLVSLIAMLIYRFSHPVTRYLSRFEDYLVWVVTFLPLLSGYLAYHHMINPYPLILGLHILTVEILLVVFPFSKLMHAITSIIGRWYTGAAMGRKGVES